MTKDNDELINIPHKLKVIKKRIELNKADNEDIEWLDKIIKLFDRPTTTQPSADMGDEEIFNEFFKLKAETEIETPDLPDTGKWENCFVPNYINGAKDFYFYLQSIRADLSQPKGDVDLWNDVDDVPFPKGEKVLLYCPDRGCQSNPERLEYDYGDNGRGSFHAWATKWKIPSMPNQIPNTTEKDRVMKDAVNKIRAESISIMGKIQHDQYIERHLKQIAQYEKLGGE